MNRKQKIFLWIVVFIVAFLLTLPLVGAYGTKGRIAQGLVIATMPCFWHKKPKEHPTDEQKRKQENKEDE